MAGTNDIASTTEQFKLETIKSNILSIVDLAHAHNINVVIASLLPVSDYNKWPDGRQRIRTDARPAEMLKEINVWFREMARERGLVFIDYYAATVDEKGFLKADASNDGLHPNDNGYRLMKPLVEDGIKAALKQKQKPLR